MSECSIPRGFSRYYILGLLKTRPYTGKEIIEHAIEQSRGVWRPSPGLIYPLLGRLLEEQLIEEVQGGYKITKRGMVIADDVDKVGEMIKKQLGVLCRVCHVGGFVIMDILEKLSMMGSVFTMTEEQTKRYKEFLESELEKLKKD